MGRSNGVRSTRVSFARSMVTLTMIGLVTTQPSWAAVDDGALKALLAEVQSVDINSQKNPAGLLAGYTKRLTHAIFGSDTLPRDVPPPTLTASEERDLRLLVPQLAKVVAAIFQRRGRAPASGEPNDTGGIGGLFWVLDGGTKRGAGKAGGWEHTLSKAVGEAMMPAKPATREEACSAVCKTLERIDEWGYDGSPVASRWTGSDRINSEGQWAFALWSMEALFVVEAAPRCPSVPKRAQILKGMLDRWIGTGKLTPGTLTSDGKFGPAGLHFSNLLLGRLKTFAARHPELAESLPEAVKTPQKVEALRAQTFDRLKGVVKDFASLNSGLGGSNLELHTLTSFLSGLGPDAKTVMAQILERTKSNKGSHAECKIPYDPVRFDGAIVNPRESAGRCVPFYLASFLTGGNTPENRRRLLSALENWGDFSGDLLFHVPRNGVHAYGTRDQLAPYYYPPTVLPSLSAAQLLVNASKGVERDRAVKALETANRAAMAAYLGDGRWVHPTSQGSGFFGKGAESFATTGPATAMAMVCAGTGDSGAYAGVSPPELNKTEEPPPPTRPPTPPPKPNHDGDKDRTPPPGPPLRERPEERRSPEELLGDRLKADLPKAPADAPAFVRGLGAAERRPVRDALRRLLRGDRGAGPFRKFRAAAGNPSNEVLDAITAAFDAEERSVEARLLDPADEINAPWVALLTDRSLSLHRKDQAVSLVNKLRKAARGGDEARAEAYALAARWVASLTSDQRKRATELLDRLELPSGDRVPAEVATNDALVKRILSDALLRHAAEGGGATADSAREKAKTFARQWNDTLREAVPAGGAIDLAKQITVHEDGGKKTSVRDWIEANVKDIGYDELVRWATGAGGETGEKTLALLAKLDADKAGGKGTPQLGLKARSAPSVPVTVGEGKSTPVASGGAVLDLSDKSGGSARTNLARMAPPHSAVWEHGEFVRPQDLGAGPLPRLQFDGAPAHGENPAPPPPRREAPTLADSLGKCVVCHAEKKRGPQTVAALETKLRTKTGPEIRATIFRMRSNYGNFPAEITRDVEEAIVSRYAQGGAPPPANPPAKAKPSLAKFTDAKALDEKLVEMIQAARAAGRRVRFQVTHENCLLCRGKPEEMRRQAQADGSTDLFVSLHLPASRPALSINANDAKWLKALGVTVSGFPMHTVLQATVPPRAPANDDADPVARYENLHYGDRAKTKRERFSYPDPPVGPPFKDVPLGGTGKLILAYFGSVDDPELKRMIGSNPLVEVRRYPIGSPEHQHASLFRTQALALDGLGRKITRYAMTPREALASLLADKTEQRLLQAYLDAKKKSAPPPSDPPARPKPSGSSAEIRETSHFKAAVGSCVECHRKSAKFRQEPLAPLREPVRLVEAMGYMNDARLKEMLDQANVSDQSKDHVRAFVAAVRAERGSKRRGGADLSACFFPAAEVAAKRRGLPQIAATSSALAGELGADRDRTVFLPKGPAIREHMGVYGSWGLLGKAEASTDRRDSNDKVLQYWDHGMMDWNWSQTAGIHGGPNVAAERFLLPPPSGPLAKAKEEKGEPDPRFLGGRSKKETPRALWLFGTSSNVWGPRLTWEYQPGTVFGEVLKIKDPQSGEMIPFEVRLRKKLDDGSWQMDVLRPFESPSELGTAVVALCEGTGAPRECAQAEVAAFVADMKAPTVTTRGQEEFVNATMLRSSNPNNPPADPLKLNKSAGSALQPRAAVHRLPALPATLVRRLLTTTPFKSVFGKPWIPASEGRVAGWAPSSDTDFNIVPKNYFGAFLPTTKASCTKCHEAAGAHVDNFDPPESLKHDRNDTVRNRTWYGTAPGMDGIFMSWWDPSKTGSAPDFSALHPCLQRGLFEMQR